MVIPNAAKRRATANIIPAAGLVAARGIDNCLATTRAFAADFGFRISPGEMTG
jgi:hypothetical protein